MIADAAAEADTDLVPMDVDAPLRPVEGMLPMHRMRQRVAAIDCGTNSIRLLVADLSLTPAGPLLVDVHREMRVVRLGEGVDATGVLAGSALDRDVARAGRLCRDHPGVRCRCHPHGGDLGHPGRGQS